MKKSAKAAIAAAFLVSVPVQVLGQGADDSDDEDEEHVHYIDPSMDGHCVACIGARRIFCLDGSFTKDDQPGDKSDFSLGSCQPSWADCTKGGR